MSKHRLDGNAWCKETVLWKLFNRILEQLWDDFIVAWELAEDFLQDLHSPVNVIMI
jgi:hypothetical protein